MTDVEVWLPAAVAATMAGQGRAHAPDETGGLLLGYWHDDHAVVVACTGPGPNARHEPRSMDPDHGWQEQQLAIAYRNTDGMAGYLGDWHTHPDGTPVPSWRDLRVMQRIANHDEARAERPVIVIVAIGENPALAAWVWKPLIIARSLAWPRARQARVRDYDAE